MRRTFNLKMKAAVVSTDGGEEEIRTPDPHVANVMLYQLSYFPLAENGNSISN